MNYLPFRKYQYGNSRIHKLDPRTKLFGLIIILMAIVWVREWYQLGVLITIVILGIIFSNSKFKQVLRDILSFKLFYIITILIHIIFPYKNVNCGDTQRLVYSLGLMQGIFFAVKIAVIGLLAGLLNRTTPSSEWAVAVETLVPSHTRLARLLRHPAIVFGLALRMLPTLLQEAERIRWSQIGRGLQIKGGFKNRIKSLPPLILPLLTSSFHHFEQITTAMLSRGFNPTRPRVYMYPLKMTLLDWVVLLLILILSIGSIVSINLFKNLYG